MGRLQKTNPLRPFFFVFRWSEYRTVDLPVGDCIATTRFWHCGLFAAGLSAGALARGPGTWGQGHRSPWGSEVYQFWRHPYGHRWLCLIWTSILWLFWPMFTLRHNVAPLLKGEFKSHRETLEPGLKWWVLFARLWMCAQRKPRPFVCETSLWSNLYVHHYSPVLRSNRSPCSLETPVTNPILLSPIGSFCGRNLVPRYISLSCWVARLYVNPIDQFYPSEDLKSIKTKALPSLMV